MNIEWKFREMSKGEMNADPIEGEFFSVDHLDSITDALVRETIQNSLDAGISGGQVTVRYHLGQADAENKINDYFSSLQPHLHAKQNGLIDIPAPTDPINYLLVEDFGTRGLEGDFFQDNDLQQTAVKNDFFYFWRNVGRSGKSHGDRGRWGLGKTVFQAASRINSFWGVTVRESDKQILLMGQSVLKTHLIGSRKHYPYGWYGTFEGDFPLPVNHSFAEQFCADFLVDRAGKTGLSVIVPYPDQAIDIQGIIGSVLIHYFYPILAGTLIVEVCDKERSHKIRRDSIDQYIHFISFGKGKLSRDNFLSLFNLARWALTVKQDESFSLKLSDTFKTPEWSEDHFEPEVLEKLRKDFEEGSRISLRVPLRIQEKDKGKHSQKAFFDVFAERDPGLELAEDHFIREGITLAGVKSLRHKGVRVIVSVNDKVLSTMLGDAENPAHTEWQERSPKFKDRYYKGASCLRFVKNAPRELVSILTRPSRGKDLDLLRDILFIDESDNDPESKRPNPKPGFDAAGKQPFSPNPEASSDFLITRIKDGFRVSRGKSKATPAGSFVISAAYAIRRGDPFARYSPFDFEMDKPPIKVRIKNSKVLKLLRNHVLAHILEPDFIVEVVGFDPHRDLVVKAEKVKKDIA